MKIQEKDVKIFKIISFTGLWYNDNLKTLETYIIFIGLSILKENFIFYYLIICFYISFFISFNKCSEEVVKEKV
jgi:hypothetical protein